MRSFVSAAYPLVDADGDTVTVAVGERERLQDPQAMALRSRWQHRLGPGVFVIAVASLSGADTGGGQWTHAQGVQVEAQPDGEGY